jgi:hypothetical protein
MARVSRKKATVARPRVTPPRSAAARLDAAEALFQDFKELTPFRFRPFVKSFDTWDDYERWRRAQTNPWYR